MTSAGPIYRVGAALLDIDNPAKVIKRGAAPILAPRADYERIGDINNVCFASGAVIDTMGNIKLYYGAADTSICVALGTLEQIMTGGLK